MDSSYNVFVSERICAGPTAQQRHFRIGHARFAKAKQDLAQHAIIAIESCVHAMLGKETAAGRQPAQNVRAIATRLRLGLMPLTRLRNIR